MNRDHERAVFAAKMMALPPEPECDHQCWCGTANHTPHETGQHGCVRFLTEAPIPDGAHETLLCPMWKMPDGNRITDFTLRQQRGYHQHACGCWSTHGGSSNSIET